jgi:hypothetical protein
MEERVEASARESRSPIEGGYDWRALCFKTQRGERIETDNVS